MHNEINDMINRRIWIICVLGYGLRNLVSLFFAPGDPGLLETVFRLARARGIFAEIDFRGRF